MQYVLPLCPACQPVATVDLVLIEEVREALGQLQATHGAGLLQETPQRRVHATGAAGSRRLPGRQQARQRRHEAPSERVFVQRRTRWHGGPAEHGTVGPPQETGRQFHAYCRADTLAGGQLHLQPLAHALALHQETFFFEGRQGVVPQPAGNGREQLFEAVAVEDNETRVNHTAKDGTVQAQGVSPGGAYGTIRP